MKQLILEAEQHRQGNDTLANTYYIQACYILELIGMLERTACFGQTGNVKVIARRCMDFFWLSAVVRKGCLPVLSDIVRITSKGSGYIVSIRVNKWPEDPLTKEPLLASLAAQAFHYSDAFANVSFVFNLCYCSSDSSSTSLWRE